MEWPAAGRRGQPLLLPGKLVANALHACGAARVTGSKGPAAAASRHIVIVVVRHGDEGPGKAPSYAPQGAAFLGGAPPPAPMSLP